MVIGMGPNKTTSTPSGWYPDPQQPGMYRYFDGYKWTSHQQPLQ
jgi:hypothetical protein